MKQTDWLRSWVSTTAWRHAASFNYRRCVLRQPIRGGIEIGLGTNLSEDEIYRPVLERAHFLESKEADYPRIVVGGDALWNYLNALEKIPPAIELDKHTQRLASQAKTLVTLDTDGLRMLDFLGQRISNLSTPEARQKLFFLARDYINEQKQVAQTIKDVRHRSRYDRLDSYFDPVPLFGTERFSCPPIGSNP